ncbi:MAG: hypothetical protein V3W41_15805 [Planctomycetota bacterium]
MIKRRKFIIDGRFQKPIMYWGALLPFSIAAAFVAVVFLVPNNASLEALSGIEIQWLLVGVAASFLLATTAGTTIIAVLLTHRVFGAEYVIRTALEGFVVGDHRRRLSLRKHDYLCELAKTCRLVSLRMESREAILEAIRKAVDEGADLGQLSELLERESARPKVRETEPVAS